MREQELRHSELLAELLRGKFQEERVASAAIFRPREKEVLARVGDCIAVTLAAQLFESLSFLSVSEDASIFDIALSMKLGASVSLQVYGESFQILLPLATIKILLGLNSKEDIATQLAALSASENTALQSLVTEIVELCSRSFGQTVFVVGVEEFSKTEIRETASFHFDSDRGKFQVFLQVSKRFRKRIRSYASLSFPVQGHRHWLKKKLIGLQCQLEIEMESVLSLLRLRVGSRFRISENQDACLALSVKTHVSSNNEPKLLWGAVTRESTSDALVLRLPKAKNQRVEKIEGAGSI